ncbi:hypothetical protein DFH27DRAFT_546302 [Peziza echinospora]|nr:hypothetical protein DFH27DRAFT_546302 [Peziza echinospora]
MKSQPTLVMDDKIYIADLKNKLTVSEVRVEHTGLVGKTRELDLQEEYRKLNIQKVIIEVDRDKAQLTHEALMIHANGLLGQIGILHQQLADTTKQAGGSKKEIVTLRRELERAKAEISAFSGVSEKSNGLLSTKIALEHRVSELETELDALRDVSKKAQTHLAQNYTLQNTINELTAQLEGERRNVERLEATVAKSDQAGKSTESEIEAMRAQLAEVKKELRDAKKELADKEKEKSQTEKVTAKLEKDLAKVKAEAEAATKLKKEVADLKQALNKETKARESVERDFERSKEDWENREKVYKAKIEMHKKSTKDKKDVNAKKRPAAAAALTMEDLEATTKKPRTKGPTTEYSAFSMTPFFKRQGASKEDAAPGDETVLNEDEQELVLPGAEPAGEEEAGEEEEERRDEEPSNDAEASEPAAAAAAAAEAAEAPPAPAKKSSAREGKAAAVAAPAEAVAAAAAPKEKKKSAKARKAAQSLPVVVASAEPTRNLLAAATRKKKPDPAKAKAGRNTSTILDEAFEDQLEDVIGGVKSLPVPPTPPPPPPPAAALNKAKKAARKNAVPRPAVANSLFEDRDGSGRIDFGNLDSLPMPAIGGGGVLRREFSPAKKRPKNIGLLFGGSKK